MGVIYSSYGSYAAGLALLAAVAAAAMVFTATTVRRATQHPVPATAAGHTGEGNGVSEPDAHDGGLEGGRDGELDGGRDGRREK